MAQGGSLYFSDHTRIREVGPEGIITTVAGSGASGFGGVGGDGGPATQAQLSSLYGVAVGPDGSLYIADIGSGRIRRVSSALPGFTVGETLLTAEDGNEIYVFNGSRHLRTLNALTGAVLYQFTYDANGRLIKVTDNDNNVTTIERDPSGNPTAIIAPFGQRTALTLDANGYLASGTNPAGEAYRMSYTGDGLLTQFNDPKGNASQMTYDELGRLTRDTDAAGGFKALTRSEAERSYTVDLSTALGRTTTYRVENLTTGNQRRLNTFPDGTQTELLLGTDGSRKTTLADGTLINLLQGPDPRFSMQAPLPKSLATTTGGLTSALTTARTASLADPNNPLSLTKLTDTMTLNGGTSTSVYDAATKTAKNTSAAGRTSKATIDNLGRVVQSQITGLLATDLVYDTRGRLVNIAQGTGADARTASFSYNTDGYLETLTDPVGRTAGFEYDTAGRVTRQTLPDGREIAYGYDANSNLTSLTPPGRPAHVFRYTPVNLTDEYSPPDVGAGTNNTVYEYNLDKDLTRITRPDGQVLDFGYDSAGRLSTLTLPTETIGYGYDATTGKLTSITAPDRGTLTYTYNGALLTQSAWAGSVAGSVSWTYDNDFWPISLSVNGSDSIAFQYDADSLLMRAGDLMLSRSAQNGLRTGTMLGNVTDSLSYNGFGEVATYSAKYSGTEIFKTQYSYDELGRITSKTETTGGATETFEYGYDQAGRLAEVKKNGTVTAAYTYDSNGNRLTGPGLSTTPTYDDQDRLIEYGGTTYTYTANGELRTKTTGAFTTTYQYDALGNLLNVTLPGGTAIDYLIDGEDRRIGKKVNGTLVQAFLYQGSLRPIAELDGSNTIVSRFVYATHINVPDYMIKGGVTYRIIADHLGSPRVVVNTATGGVAQRIDYDEFGQVLSDYQPRLPTVRICRRPV